MNDLPKLATEVRVQRASCAVAIVRIPRTPETEHSPLTESVQLWRHSGGWGYGRRNEGGVATWRRAGVMVRRRGGAATTPTSHPTTTTLHTLRTDQRATGMSHRALPRSRSCTGSSATRVDDKLLFELDCRV